MIGRPYVTRWMAFKHWFGIHTYFVDAQDHGNHACWDNRTFRCFCGKAVVMVRGEVVKQ